jgi:hypothetical protein
MAQKGDGNPRLKWPPDLDEILRRMHKEEMRSWLTPKSGDLLRDVLYLSGRAAKEKDKAQRGIYARAAIVMSVATIEAVTNDVLATIFELLRDSIPSECTGEPPWSHFRGRSNAAHSIATEKGDILEKAGLCA